MRSPTHEDKAPLAVIASDDADYERLNLARDAVAPWEDGVRTDNRRGTYEWWYLDAHLDDGASLVVVFMNKDLASPNDPLTPTIRIDLDLADGRSYQKLVTYAPEHWQASTSIADVRIGENRFSGDLHTYRIQAVVEEIAVDVTLVAQLRAWRPQTGYLLYGAGRDKEFAWLPSVPQGAVTATYRVGDEAHETTGIGYHDHNWGNVSLAYIVHDWYWARGQAGPYSVIASLVTAHERYGRITSHERRHTFGTRMAASGTPMRTLQQWMGHADSKTTQIYAHYQPSDQEADAVDRAFA